MQENAVCFLLSGDVILGVDITKTYLNTNCISVRYTLPYPYIHV